MRTAIGFRRQSHALELGTATRPFAFTNTFSVEPIRIQRLSEAVLWNEGLVITGLEVSVIADVHQGSCGSTWSLVTFFEREQKKLALSVASCLRRDCFAWEGHSRVGLAINIKMRTESSVRVHEHGCH